MYVDEWGWLRAGKHPSADKQVRFLHLGIHRCGNTVTGISINFTKKIWLSFRWKSPPYGAPLGLALTVWPRHEVSRSSVIRMIRYGRDKE